MEPIRTSSRLQHLRLGALLVPLGLFLGWGARARLAEEWGIAATPQQAPAPPPFVPSDWTRSCQVHPAKNCSGTGISTRTANAPWKREFLARSGTYCLDGPALEKWDYPIRVGMNPEQRWPQQSYVEPAPDAADDAVAGKDPLCVLTHVHPQIQHFQFDTLPAVGGCRDGGYRVLVVPWEERLREWHMELLRLVWNGEIIALRPKQTVLAPPGSAVPCFRPENDYPPVLGWRLSPQDCDPEDHGQPKQVWDNFDMMRNRLCEQAEEKVRTIGFEQPVLKPAVYAIHTDTAGSGRSLINREEVEEMLGRQGFGLWDPLAEGSFAGRMVALNHTKFLLLDQGSDQFQALFLPFDGCVLYVVNPNNNLKPEFALSFTEGLGGCWVPVEGVVRQEFGATEFIHVPHGNQLVLEIDGVENRAPRLNTNYRWDHIRELNGEPVTPARLAKMPIGGGRGPFLEHYTVSFSYDVPALSEALRHLTQLPFEELRMIAKSRR